MSDQLDMRANDKKGADAHRAPLITKAVILARGLGTRMRRVDADSSLSGEQRTVADSGLKAMIPIGRPFLDFVLSALADAGVLQVCLVIGPEHQRVREYYDAQVAPERLRIAFAEQAEPRGTADAVLAARRFAGDDAFLVLNADNYYPVASYRTLIEHGGPGLPGYQRDALMRLSNIDREKIRRYALLQVDRDGFLEDIVEKPDDLALQRFGEQALVSMNLWSFSPRIFEACERVPLSSRGEFELPQAVRLAVSQLGERFRVFPFALGVLDLSSRGDIAAVAEGLSAARVSL